MGALSELAAALALLGAAPSVDHKMARWQPLIDLAARRCGVPAAWIASVMRAESGGRTQLGGRPIVSPKGAMGLMQLMPATWAELRRVHGLGNDPHDPHDNIVAGACYLEQMHARFGHPGLFAAYNAGPGRYAAYRAGRARLPRETRTYLARVTTAPGSPRRGIERLPSPIFFDLGAAATPAMFVHRALPRTPDAGQSGTATISPP
jgi:soluble lytic murein transglycosylase-like protein